ncbi:MAG: nitroreductase family protein [Arenicella sp.]|nr:nitroreductase family protein [Arenicella sp.]
MLKQIMMLRGNVRGNHSNDRAISKSNIEKILRAGSLAPSVGFSQPWEFVVNQK